MPETYKPLSSFTVHAWMPEKMGLQYPELYVYALFSTAGVDGIPATKPATRDMARLCGISEATFYRVRNRLLMMGLLFSRSFSGSQRIYYVTDRVVPLPYEKPKRQPSTVPTKSLADASNFPESGTVKTESMTDSPYISTEPTDALTEKFAGDIKALVCALRKETDAILLYRDRLFKRLERYSETFSDAWEDVREMMDELMFPGWDDGDFDGGDAPEGESGLFEGTAGCKAAKKSPAGGEDTGDTPDGLTPDEIEKMRKRFGGESPDERS
ncbi:MAG: hypothetical protein LUD72_08800 [Bacteroidales bacterium]|nr:hypothetical protein [Bacteroidales bacterium]